MSSSHSAPNASSRNTHPPATPALTTDSSWTRLFDRSKNLLRSYKKILDFYVKWHDFVGSYQPMLNQHKTLRRTTALDALVRLAAQEGLLVDLGASRKLFRIAQNLEALFSLEPRGQDSQREFVDEIVAFIDEMVVAHPKDRFPTADKPYRARLIEEFDWLSSDIQDWINAVKRAVKRHQKVQAYKAKKAAESSGTSVPAEALPIDATPRDRRARRRNLVRAREMTIAARAVEDSVRPITGMAMRRRDARTTRSADSVESEVSRTSNGISDGGRETTVPVPDASCDVGEIESVFLTDRESSPTPSLTSSSADSALLLRDPDDPLPYQAPLRRRPQSSLLELFETPLLETPRVLFDCRMVPPPPPPRPSESPVNLRCVQERRSLKRSYSETEIDNLRDNVPKRQNTSPRSVC